MTSYVRVEIFNHSNNRNAISRISILICGRDCNIFGTNIRASKHRSISCKRKSPTVFCKRINGFCKKKSAASCWIEIYSGRTTGNWRTNIIHYFYSQQTTCTISIVIIYGNQNKVSSNIRASKYSVARNNWTYSTTNWKSDQYARIDINCGKSWRIQKCQNCTKADQRRRNCICNCHKWDTRSINSITVCRCNQHIV